MSETEKDTLHSDDPRVAASTRDRPQRLNAFSGGSGRISDAGQDSSLCPLRRPFLRRFGMLAAMALCLTWVAPGAFAQVKPTSPEAKSFNLGALKISVLRDGALIFPNDGAIFGLNAGSAAVAKVLGEAGTPPDTIRLDINILLVRMPGHVILVDTGYGSSHHGIVQESLALVGVSPDEITDILITHAHPDHIGGLVDAQERSVFPKATIWMSAKEWAFMQNKHELRQVLPVIRTQVKTFEPGRPILPGITPMDLAGHTPGHVGYEIVSQGYRLMAIGDVAHSSIISLAKPEWTLAWDADKQEAVRARRHELQRLADTRELVFAPHFPFPGVGRIEQAGDGFRFEPGLPWSVVGRNRCEELI